MADLAEILLVEHLAIRHISKTFTNPKDLEPFVEFHTYLKECHIEIEEKLLFPLLEAHYWDDSGEFNAKANRILADHRLIDTLSRNIINWHSSGDLELVTDRYPLYFKLLHDHNKREEESVFPRWSDLPQDEIKDTVKEAKSIIESFGTGKYLEMTGLTEHGFYYLFR